MKNLPDVFYQGGSFRSTGMMRRYGNPLQKTVYGVGLAVRLIIGLNVNGVPHWKKHHVVDWVGQWMSDHFGEARATFMVGEGLWGKQAGTRAIPETSVQVLVIKTFDMSDEEFLSAIDAMVEDALVYFRQQEILEDVMVGGVTKQLYGVQIAPPPHSYRTVPMQ